MSNSRIPLTILTTTTAVFFAAAGARAELINHWKFDESLTSNSAVDSAGSLNLTLWKGDGDSANKFISGQRSNALEFDGINDNAYNHGEPFTSDIDHTVAAWVMHYGKPLVTQRWISWGTDDGRYFLGPDNVSNEGRVNAGIGPPGTQLLFAYEKAIPKKNLWQYWTFVREGNNASLYLNGKLVQEITQSYCGLISADGELAVGRQYKSHKERGHEWFHGAIDDLAIWGEALIQAYIQNAMNYGAENYKTPEPSTLVLLAVGGLIVLPLLRRRNRRRSRRNRPHR